MKVYLTGARAAASPNHVVYVSPAGHLQSIDGDKEMPGEWVTEANEPTTFPVVFKFGAAEVPSNLGAYMIKFGLASKTRLILPDGVRAA